MTMKKTIILTDVYKRQPMNIKGFRRMLFGEKMPDKNCLLYTSRCV